VVNGARTGTVLSGSVELAVLEAGDRSRPTVVLVHGYPDTKEVWREVMSRLADRTHVVAYDVRGAGRSSAPRGAADYDLARLGDDLLAVSGELASGGIHLVGHDWGAIQGWEFVADPRFRGVIASFSAIAGPSLDQVSASVRELLAAGRLLEALRRVRRSYYIALLWLPGGPELIWRVLISRDRWRRGLARREQLSLPADYPGETLAQDGISGANLYRRNIPRRTVRPTLRRALVPVQLIVPKGDRFIPSEYYELAERFAPDVRRHTVPGSHWAPLAVPELVAALIERFVADVESRSEAPHAANGD
jgi:pimeloyl-ACP methyl ester carboxylesterase